MQHNVLELIGRKFERLSVIGFDGIENHATKWLCECDCGNKKVVYGQLLTSGGVKSCGCLKKETSTKNLEKAKLTGRRSGKNHHWWKTGRIKTADGYIRIKKPDHTNSTKDGYILDHIFVMSEFLGRPLGDNETVHHKNGIKDDNRIKNLELWVSNHTPGQRVSDITEFAIEHLKKYSPRVLKSGL